MKIGNRYVAWPPFFSIDTKSNIKSIWLGWWLITWSWDGEDITDFSIDFIPDGG